MRTAGPFVLGYHGCDRAAARRILEGGPFTPSVEDFDWLGPGAYFWENDPQRALEWAIAKQARGRCDDPCVVGAVIDLGHCLDLTLRGDLDLLRVAYDSLREANETAGLTMPVNRDFKSSPGGDKPLRYLDCAVLRHLHANIEQEAEEIRRSGGRPLIEPFAVVRGMFFEGDSAYPGGGFYSHTHVQLAVCDPAAIRGAFIPRPYPVSSGGAPTC